MSMTKAALSVLVSVLLVVIVGISCGGQVEPTPTQAPEPPAGPTLRGADLLQERCTGCHGLDQVEAVSKTEAEWEATVERMRGKGADLTDDEAQTLVEYLAESYGL
jgi:cytochrome c5